MYGLHASITSEFNVNKSNLPCRFPFLLEFIKFKVYSCPTKIKPSNHIKLRPDHIYRDLYRNTECMGTMYVLCKLKVSALPYAILFKINTEICLIRVFGRLELCIVLLIKGRDFSIEHLEPNSSYLLTDNIVFSSNCDGYCLSTYVPAEYATS